MNHFTSLLCVFISCFSLSAQQATLKESSQKMGTYGFDDPDPVPNPENLYYPYFRYDGFTNTKTERNWKTVVLENKYIRVTLFPEIGGKIWGAVDKTSGKEFIYNNHVVKFRDIAMRGPWVSGGIEYNFGIIGHAPTSATPVDYATREKEDGSVSCYLSAIDLLTRTRWTVEVNVPADKAYFTTHTTWHNSSAVDQPYYQWMNAGYKAGGNVQFCYPGNQYIGHGGDAHTFPNDKQGRDLSWYKNNAFGSSKSYHVLGYYNDFYGAYWHDDDFGSVHHAAYHDKLGMKIFLWSQARDGAIWEELLTDTDGQYVELQSGRLYNQPATASARTPFKHPAFRPAATDEWTEYWYPVKGTKGMVKGSRIGALNVVRDKDSLHLHFSPTQPLSDTLRLYASGKEINAFPLQAQTLQPWHRAFPLGDMPPAGKLKVTIGDGLLVYSEEEKDNRLNRPTELPSGFDWNSAYGRYTRGEQAMNQKLFDQAETDLKAALEKDPYFAPALVRLASLTYRLGRYDESLALCRRALSLNAYDGEANYLYGLCNVRTGNETDANDGFAVASYDPAFRTAAYSQLAAASMRKKDWKKAIGYAEKSLQTNTVHLDALQTLLVCYRRSGETKKALSLQKRLAGSYPLDHRIRYEGYLLNPGPEARARFSSAIRNELPAETYLELAGWYRSAGCTDEAIDLLSFIPGHPVACYLKAWLLSQTGKTDEADRTLEQAGKLSPFLIFPFRPEHLEALTWASSRSDSWKPVYYRAMILHACRNKAKALELLQSRQDADYAPFYLYRASLETGAQRLADLQKAETFGNDWRTGMALIKHYAALQNWEEADRTAARYYRLFPDQYMIGLQYAKTLCETGKYAACISLLDKIHVLPNEGAYAGRQVYRNAHLFEAMRHLKSGKNAKALQAIAGSKIWRENLGVGKPYEERIDYRLENFLEAQAHGKGKKAQALLEKVAAHPHNPRYFQSADLLTVTALRLTGREAEADRRVSSWKKQYAGNPAAAWCAAVYEGDKAHAAELLKKRKVQDETTPWENTRIDADFDLLVRLFAE